MRRRTPGVLAAAIVLLPLAALALFLATFDADTLKPRIAAAVLRATGRTFTIAGSVRLTLAPAPAIAADDVALANVPGGSRADLATAKRLRVTLALLPLLRGRVVLDSIALERPDVLLETDAAGRPNWQMPRAAAAAGPSGPAGSAHRRVAVRQVAVTDGRLTWRDGRTGRSGSIALPELTITRELPDGTLQLGGTLTAGGLAAQVTASTGPALTPAHLDLHGTLAGQAVSLRADAAASGALAIDLQAAGAHLSIAGQVAQLARLTGLDLLVSAQVPDPAALAGLAGRHLALAGPLSFAARVTGDAAGSLALHGLDLRGPEGDIAGDLLWDRAAVPALRGALAARRLDLDALAAGLRQPPAASPAPAAAPDAGPVDRRLIADTPLPLAELRDADADLHLAAATLIAGGIRMAAAGAHLVLTGGRLELDQVTAEWPGGALQASLTVDASQPAPVPVALRLRAQGLAAGTLLAALHLPPLASGALDLRADLRSAGGTPRALAAGLDGTLGLAMENGAIDDAALRPALAAVLRAARLPPEMVAGSASSAIRCLAAGLDFAAGRGTVRPLLMDSSLVHVEGDGEVDLADETMLLNLRPLARLGGAGIAVPLRVSGTLRAPRGQIDTGALAAAGGGGFRAVLGALDEAATSEACGPALAAARGRAAPSAEPPAPRAAKPPKTIDLLRKLFR